MKTAMSREVFVDSGAWIALSDTRDKYHAAAIEQFRVFLEDRLGLITTNLVIAEVYTLIRRTGGYDPAMKFLRSTRESIHLNVIYLDRSLEDGAEEILSKYKDQDFSLVDAVSFALMRERGIERAFAFDRHFIVAGFQITP
jgi:predicted nucleic acid-binding protein